MGCGQPNADIRDKALSLGLHLCYVIWDTLPNRLPFRLLVVSLALSLTAALSVSSASGVDGADDPSGPPTLAERGRAAEVLTEAKALFAGGGQKSARRGSAEAKVERRDATLVLRELALRADDLATPEQRTTARRILARPTTTDDPTGGYEPKYETEAGTKCGARICVHWVEDHTIDSMQGDDVDGDVSTVPAWANTSLTVLENVYIKEVTDRQYRAPLSDGTRGGSVDKLDVYLADLGSSNLYGYCTSDQPDRNTAQVVFAYCVIDQDFARDQYETNTPGQNLQVTAAHEFFHAVQFAYDWQEDDWLMEGTAAWMEDEIYDSINDNLQYLGASQLQMPFNPLDHSSFDDPNYGVWIFWRFLSEWAGAGDADDPTIVRQVWEGAAVDGAYSTLALRRTLLARGTSFPVMYTLFGTWIRSAKSMFEEGPSYPNAPADFSLTLTQARPSTGNRTVTLDHMTHSFTRLTPGSTLTGTWRVTVSVNMPDTARGSVAQMIVHKRNGTRSVLGIPLNTSGNGSKVFGFTRTAIHYLDLDLVNTSARFQCWQDTYLSCQGSPLDDTLDTTFSARAIR